MLTKILEQRDRIVHRYIDRFLNNVIYPWQERDNKKEAHAHWKRRNDWYLNEFYKDTTKAGISLSLLFETILERMKNRIKYCQYDDRFLVAFLKHDPSFDNKLKILKYFSKRHSSEIYENLEQVMLLLEKKKYKDKISKMIVSLFLDNPEKLTLAMVLKANSFAKDAVLEILRSNEDCVSLAKERSKYYYIRKKDKEFYELIVWLAAMQQEKEI